MANESLRAAKKAKNDEFYTVYDYIQKEMNAYLEYDPNVFRGKTVLLPCDDPEWSNFTKYFAQNFQSLGLKKLISTSFAHASKSPIYRGDYQLTFFESDAPEYDESKSTTHGKIFTLTRDNDNSGAVDIDDLEWHYLEGDGDFRSDEVKALRDEADIIVTNPPFSLFREFVSWAMEANKKIVVIGSQNAITYKEIFPLLKDNRLWIGATNNGQDMVFEVPEGAVVDPRDREKAERLGYKGNYTRLGNARWFTNIDHGRRHQPLSLMTMEDNLKFSRHKDIRENGYRHYDNYDAIEVPYVDAIPSDYVTDMGVPITYLDKHNPEQFEVVKFRKGNDEKDLTYTVQVGDNPDTHTTDYSVLPHHHPPQDVTALWASQSLSSTSTTPTNTKLLEQQRARERASLVVCGMQKAELPSQLSAENESSSDCSSAARCNGIMGVPITFLDKFNPDQFEIVGITKTWFGGASKIYPQQTQIDKNGKKSLVSKLNDGAVIKLGAAPSGETYYVVDDCFYTQVYARILIRKR